MSLNKIAASKPKRADRSRQRYLGGEFRRLHQLQEGVFLLELAIFRQRAARLAHEPDRRAVHRLGAAAGVEQPPAVGQSGRGEGRVGGSGVIS